MHMRTRCRHLHRHTIGIRPKPMDMYMGIRPNPMGTMCTAYQVHVHGHHVLHTPRRERVALTQVHVPAGHLAI